MSLDDVYETGLKHALKNIERNGGKVTGENVSIKTQLPVAVKFEKSFEGIYPAEKKKIKWSDDKTMISFEFTGTGFALKGETAAWESVSSFVFNTELYVDDQLIESPQLPASYTTRRYDLCWKYDLPKNKHTVKFKILNPSKEMELKVWEAIIYSDKRVDGIKANVYADKNKLR
jgi:hypothetical protein